VASSPSPDAESRRLELQEAIVFIRHQTMLGAQAAGVVLTANTLLLAYGFAERVAGILLIASTMPLLVQGTKIFLVEGSLPFFYTALVLERELALDTAPLIGTLALKALKPVTSILGDDCDVSGTAARDAVLGIPLRAWLRGRLSMTYYCCSAAQLLLFIVSIAVYHYRFM
jgi:hypothetical protein